MSNSHTARDASPPLMAEAVAHSNIALAKYWGKLDKPGNFPAVPSLSLTLDQLITTTRVHFDASLAADSFSLDGKPVTGRPLLRVIHLLDEVRERAGLGFPARVESNNSFPTASGLASSASGFAALALASSAAAGLKLNAPEQSALARRASASAARSIFGGYVALRVGAESAEPLLAPDAWPLCMIVVVTETRPKATSSTDAMLHTAKTSPYYSTWLTEAPRLFEDIEGALGERHLERLGIAMEASSLLMHATMLAAEPSILYFNGATLEVMDKVRSLRSTRLPAYFTMDAGPHVKVLTDKNHAARVAAELQKTPGVERVLVCAPGPEARVTRIGAD